MTSKQELEARPPRTPPAERLAAGVIASYIHEISDRHRADEPALADSPDPHYDP
jgi:hypothetical protein